MVENTNNCVFCEFKSDCFKALNRLELELADTKRVELKYKKGENIAKQGAFVTHILYLQKGLVKIYKEINKKNNLILNIFSGGNLIGLPNLFKNSTMHYSVAAIEDSVICAIDKKVIEEFILSNGEFAKSVIESINNCTIYHYDKIVSTSYKQLPGRMADVLIHLSQNVHKSLKFKLSLSRKELGEFAGMSLMSSVKIIKDFEANNLIGEKNGWIEIKDINKLIDISKNG
ncbi:MAG: hypothetical protein Kow0068_17300 [Marinilabiliales bacterium]